MSADGRWFGVAAVVAGIPAVAVVVLAAAALGREGVDGVWRLTGAGLLAVAIAGVGAIAAGAALGLRGLPPPRPAKLIAIGTTAALVAGVLLAGVVILSDLG